MNQEDLIDRMEVSVRCQQRILERAGSVYFRFVGETVSITTTQLHPWCANAFIDGTQVNS